MNIMDIIAKKRDGGELSPAEIEYVVHEKFANYQLTSFLMAVYLKSMTENEIFVLTQELAKSGKTLNFSDDDAFVDLHSTGGVGDKCTMIVCPIVAACGGKVAKLAGRGLGYTGGTIDKLESFPGFKSAMSTEEFESQARKISLVIAAQSPEMAPRDGEFYHLRDVTATVESLPLIASSIMSKKLATGCKNIVLDVTYGSGAFMKTKKQAKQLAKLMLKIGTTAGKKVITTITSMNQPLGNCIGNAIEVRESISFLKGELPEIGLQKTVTLLAANMLELSLKMPFYDAVNKINESIQNGSALAKFREMVEEQGGAWQEEFTLAPKQETRILEDLDALEIGKLVHELGGGRNTIEDKIDLTVGLQILNRKTKEVKIFSN